MKALRRKNVFELADELRALAKVGRPINDVDYATKRQIDAENAFFARLEELGVDLDKLFINNLKATADERIDAGLREAGIVLKVTI